MSSDRTISLSMTRAIVVATLALAPAGCKQDGPTCSPGSIKWNLQLALQSSKTINPTDDGESLPTVIRVFQLRGELALDNLEFDSLWEAEEPSALGESFLSMEELTLFPDQREVRELPVEGDATHVLAAGLFRAPASTSWFTSYEIPQQHPEIVCAKAPNDKVYPDPCFYLMLDRNVLDGGANPPPGYEIDPAVQCAPLGVAPTPEESPRDRRRRKRKERRQKRRNDRLGIEETPDELEQQLQGLPDGSEVQDVNVPDPKVPDVNVPDVNAPNVNVPDVNAPKVNAPKVNAPKVNAPKVNVPKR